MKITRRYSLLIPVLILSQGLFAADPGELLVYFGTYTRGASKGIYAYRFQPKTGDLKPIGLVEKKSTLRSSRFIRITSSSMR